MVWMLTTMTILILLALIDIKLNLDIKKADDAVTSTANEEI